MTLILQISDKHRQIYEAIVLVSIIHLFMEEVYFKTRDPLITKYTLDA